MKIKLIILLTIFAAVPGFAFAQASLEDLIEQGLNNNPDVRQIYHRWKAAESRIGYVKGLPDPKLNYTFFGSEIQTRVGPQEHKYGFSQSVPFPSKLSLKGKVAASKAAAHKQEYEAAKRELIKNIKLAYFDLYWVDQAIGVTEEEKTILEGLSRSALGMYESAAATQSDAVKAQVELTRLIERLITFKEQRKALVSRISSLLASGKPVQIEKINKIERSEFGLSKEQLLNIALENRQELESKSYQVRAAESEKDLAVSEYLPDFSLGVDYIDIGDNTTSSVDDGTDAWSATVGITIPLWFEKIRSGINEKQELLTAQRQGYDNTLEEVKYQIEELFFKIERVKETIDLYEHALIPQAKQAFEAARLGYESGSLSFLDWLDSQRVLISTRLAYFKQLSELEKSVALLERAAGVSLAGGKR